MRPNGVRPRTYIHRTIFGIFLVGNTNCFFYVLRGAVSIVLCKGHRRFKDRQCFCVGLFFKVSSNIKWWVFRGLRGRFLVPTRCFIYFACKRVNSFFFSRGVRLSLSIFFGLYKEGLFHFRYPIFRAIRFLRKVGGGVRTTCLFRAFLRRFRDLFSIGNSIKRVIGRRFLVAFRSEGK